MLIVWSWEEPIRHDLHLKTALIMSSHRECVFFNLVNKYKSEGGRRESGGFHTKKKKGGGGGMIKCLR